VCGGRTCGEGPLIRATTPQLHHRVGTQRPRARPETSKGVRPPGLSARAAVFEGTPGHGTGSQRARARRTPPLFSLGRGKFPSNPKLPANSPGFARPALGGVVTSKRCPRFARDPRAHAPRTFPPEFPLSRIVRSCIQVAGSSEHPASRAKGPISEGPTAELPPGSDQR
jgi:hypothetical protein